MSTANSTMKGNLSRLGTVVRPAAPLGLRAVAVWPGVTSQVAVYLELSVGIGRGC